MVYLSEQSRAYPPEPTHKAGSTPADIFPEVYDEFKRGEHRRLASNIARSAGFVAMDNITSVKLCTEEGFESYFDIKIGDESSRLEAHSPEVAQEWVNRLSELLRYWTRRHRVEYVGKLGIY